MMWAIATGRNINQPDELPKGIIVKRIDSEEISVNVVARTGPKVADFLGLDIAANERWAGERWSWKLEDREGRGVACERLSYTWDSGDWVSKVVVKNE